MGLFSETTDKVFIDFIENSENFVASFAGDPPPPSRPALPALYDNLYQGTWDSSPLCESVTTSQKLS